MDENYRRAVSITPERVFIYALGVGAIGGLGYFAYEYLIKDKISPGNQSNLIEEAINPVKWIGGSSSSRNDKFPLKRGSRGNHVTLLQTGLSKVLGDKMSQYTGVDGDFGPGTEKALIAAGYPAEVDEATYNRIIGGSAGNGSFSAASVSSSSAADIASSLYDSADKKDIDGVIKALGQIKNTADYTAVNTEYKTKGIIRKTIVTDLLDYAFPYDENARPKIKAELLRIGLKLDAPTGRWSLSGLGGMKDIITLTDTIILDRKNNRIPVKKNTILGDAVKSENGYVLFKAIDGSFGIVPAKHIRYV